KSLYARVKQGRLVGKREAVPWRKRCGKGQCEAVIGQVMLAPVGVAKINPRSHSAMDLLPRLIEAWPGIALHVSNRSASRGVLFQPDICTCELKTRPVIIRGRLMRGFRQRLRFGIMCPPVQDFRFPAKCSRILSILVQHLLVKLHGFVRIALPRKQLSLAVQRSGVFRLLLQGLVIARQSFSTSVVAP